MQEGVERARFAGVRRHGPRAELPGLPALARASCTAPCSQSHLLWVQPPRCGGFEADFCIVSQHLGNCFFLVVCSALPLPRVSREAADASFLLCKWLLCHWSRLKAGVVAEG